MSQFKQPGYTDPSALSGLKVAVQGPGENEYQGTLLHFTGGTLKVQFWGDELPSFGLTQPLSVYIQGLNLELPALPACAMERNELPGGRVYRFAYTLSPEFLERIPKDLWALFPSRVSHRVKPTPEAPVSATLEAIRGGDRFPVQVVDLSSSGVGLRVDRDTETALHAQDSLRLRFQFPTLPQDACETVLTGRVVHRRMVGQEVGYGISFDVDTDSAVTGHDALIRYIVSQERLEA